MAGLAGIGAIVAIAGTALSAYSQVQQGRAQQDAARNEAAQGEIAAGQAQAAAQRRAEDTTRKTKYAISRAQAVAANSGAGASDRTVLDIVSRIAGEGAYRSALDIYGGEEQARTLKNRAALATWAGNNAATAGVINAGSTVLKGAETFYSKYGGMGAPRGSGSPSVAGGTNLGWFEDDMAT